MFLLTVLPVTRQKGIGELSYFSSQPGNRGDIVEVPLRGKPVPAVVLSANPVADAKSLIRRGTFALKKVKGAPKPGPLDAEAMQALFETANHFAARPGAALFSLVAKELLLTPTESRAERIDERSESGRPIAQKLALAAPYHERVNQYRLLVREEFARGGSVMIVVPTQAEAENMFEQLSKGIEHFTYVFHGGVTPRTLRKQLTECATESHPILRIVTYPYILVPRKNSSCIVLERENAESWRTIAAPYIDVRFFVERLANLRGIKFLLAGFPLSVAAAVRVESGELEEVPSGSRRNPGIAPIEIVDAKEDARKAEAAGEKTPAFSLFSEKTKELIMRALGEKKRIVLLATRKGLSPITICGDCGSPVLCAFSETPMALVKTKDGNQFLCRSCGDRKNAHTTCKNCGSWKLIPLGAGIERIEEAAMRQFPDTPLLVMESDRIRTHKAARKIIADFFATEPPVMLLGTEMMLPYLAGAPYKADLAIIPSMDTLLSHPAWNAYERAFGLLTRLGECAENAVVVQTRMSDNALLSFAAMCDTDSFYESETETRKALGYPPFSVLIKLTARGTLQSVKKDMAEVEAHLTPQPLLGLGAPLHQGKAEYVLNGFLRIQKASWPDPLLLEKFAALPLSVTVTIDPSSVL